MRHFLPHALLTLLTLLPLPAEESPRHLTELPASGNPARYLAKAVEQRETPPWRADIMTLRTDAAAPMTLLRIAGRTELGMAAAYTVMEPESLRGVALLALGTCEKPQLFFWRPGTGQARAIAPESFRQPFLGSSLLLEDLFAFSASEFEPVLLFEERIHNTDCHSLMLTHQQENFVRNASGHTRIMYLSRDTLDIVRTEYFNQNMELIRQRDPIKGGYRISNPEKNTPSTTVSLEPVALASTCAEALHPAKMHQLVTTMEPILAMWQAQRHATADGLARFP